MISIVMPFRDARATLSEALRSVLHDDVPVEVIAIDDGSRDGGAAVVEELGDPRVRVVRTDGVGIARALQLGLSHARGAFIARMDGDDVSLPGRFRAQLDHLQRSDAAVVATRVEAFPDPGEGLRRYVAWMNEALTRDDHARELFVEAPLCHPSVMMRRDALERVGGYRAFDGPEDYDLWLRLHAAGYAIEKLPETYLRWRHHPARATLVDPRYARERFTQTKAPHLAAAIGARPFDIWGAGPTGKRLSRALEAHGARVSRFIDIDPSKIGRTARGVPIVSPEQLTDHFVVAAVGARGARELIRADLVRRGYVERRDFLCAS